MNAPETDRSAPVFDSAYYAANYPDYDRQNPPRKLRHYARLVESHVAPGAPRRIHDMGCGFGRFLACLEASWEICGSDPSEFAIGIARKEIARGSFQVGTATGGAPGTRAVFPGRFGVVTAFDVLEHVPDLEAAAAAVKAQLVAEGLFLFVVPVYDGPCGPIVHWLDRDPTHVHKWPRRRWLDWAGTHFQMVEWIGALRYLLPVLKYYVHVPTSRLRRYTPAITVICRNKES